jgi:hypothetical protein
MACEGECAMLVSTITTFGAMIGLTICMGCAVAIYCLRQDATAVVTVINPLRGTVDEDPGPVVVAVSVAAPSRTQPEPEPTEG